MEIPKEAEKEVVEYASLRGKYEGLRQQEHAIKIEMESVKNAIDELKKTNEKYVYKNVGGLVMYKMEKEKAIEELEEHLDILEVRLKSISSQAEKVKKQLDELEKVLQKKLSLNR